MEKQAKPLTIGTLAKSAGVGVETIRFYERKGILVQPKKSAGFRVYPQEDIRKIRFVKRMQDLGFSLEEIKDFISLEKCSNETNDVIEAKAQKKMTEIKEKIDDLQKVLTSLEQFSQTCGSNKEKDNGCEIIECFENNWECCKPTH